MMRPFRVLYWTSCVAAALVLLGVPPAAATRRAPATNDSIMVQTLAELPSQFIDRHVTGLEFADRASVPDSGLWISDDGLHLAFVQDLGSRHAMVIDGVRGTDYEGIGNGAFSHEGGHFAYFAGPTARTRVAVVFDGHEYPVDDDIEVRSPLMLSPNGRRFAYLGALRSAYRSASMFVQTDATRGRTYDWVGAPVFSWDGARMAYPAIRLGHSIMVVDDRESLDFEWAGRPMFDLDGSHVRFTYARRGLVYQMKDGEPVTDYFGDTAFVASRDGAHLAYVAQTKNGQRLVVDGRAFDEWRYVVIDSSLFSPDGHLAHWAGTGSAWCVVVDGQKIWEQSEPRWPLAVSAEGGHVAHIQKLSWSERVVMDGVPGHDYDDIDGLCFAPRGARLAYRVRRGNRETVVVDQSEGEWVESVGAPMWSADGSHVAWIAWRAQDRACVVVDGREGPEFTVIVPGGPAWRADGTLEYLAVHRSDLVRVRQWPR